MNSMRIVTNASWLSPYGGIEECTLQDSAALVSRGHRIDVLYGVDGPDRDNYEAAGVHLTGPVRFAVNPWTPLRVIRNFHDAAGLAKQLQPEVLWLNRSEHIPWAQYVSRAARIPVVCHLHQVPNFQHSRPFFVGIDHFVAVSDYIAGTWIAAGIRPERITTIPNAVPMQQYPFGGLAERRSAREALGLPQDIPIVLCYGQLSAQKGIAVLARAWRELGIKPGEALLVLLGWHIPRPDREVMEALAALPANTYRLFPGQSGVVPFLHAADVVAMPTLLPEAFGRVVVESLASGRPVVASRIGAIPEVTAGFMSENLVPPGDVSALARRLRALLTWRQDSPDLGRDCRAVIEQNYHYQQHIEALERVLCRYRRTTRSSAVPLRKRYGV